MRRRLVQLGTAAVVALLLLAGGWTLLRTAGAQGTDVPAPITVPARESTAPPTTSGPTSSAPTSEAPSSPPAVPTTDVVEPPPVPDDDDDDPGGDGGNDDDD